MKVREKKIEDIQKSLEQKRQNLLDATEKVYIINAGRMNHGKSSLMNAVLGKEAFKVADIRQTIKNQYEEYQKNVFLVDTPGLDANSEDDQEAFKVYKKANYILYVHNPKIGELHKNELDTIGRIQDELGKDFLKDHFALVLTFCEAVPSDQMQEIIVNIKAAMKSHFGLESFPVFQISNSRYKKSLEQSDIKKKDIFLQKSNIPALRDFLDHHIQNWKEENRAVQERRFAKEIADTVLALQKIKATYLVRIKVQKAEYKTRFNELVQAFSQAIQHLEICQNEWKAEINKTKQLHSKVKELKERHRREKY